MFDVECETQINPNYNTTRTTIYIIFFSNFVALLCVALFLFKPFISILKYDFHNFSSHVVAKKVHDVKKHSEATSDRDRESSDYYYYCESYREREIATERELESES
jgi:hypothetical protein